MHDRFETTPDDERQDEEQTETEAWTDERRRAYWDELAALNAERAELGRGRNA